MNKKILFIVLVVFLFVSVGAFAETTSQQGDKAKQGEAAVHEKIDKLDKKIQNLQDQAGSIPQGNVSPVEDREFFNDEQSAAPRPYDVTLDPSYRGFIPVPHTKALIKINAKPRVDFTLDSANPGNTNMFVPSTFPVTGDSNLGGGFHFNANAQGSRLILDVRAPEGSGDPRFYYENDFAGAGTGTLIYHVRHLYGQLHNIIVGQTYTVFEDADAWPDTVDYEGPNAAISSRRPLVRYQWPFAENWILNVGIEMPSSQVDTGGLMGVESVNHAPEGGFNVRWEDEKLGHAQFSMIFREIGVSGGAVRKQMTFGWGASLASSINTYKNDSFQLQLTYGEGIFYFANDSTTNNDAAFNAGGYLEPIPMVALMGGYTHWWADKFRSSASFGFVDLENQSSQLWDAYHRTYYASANVIYQLFRRLSIGVEGLYGYKEVKSHASGHDYRVQVGVAYALFN